MRGGLEVNGAKLAGSRTSQRTILPSRLLRRTRTKRGPQRDGLDCPDAPGCEPFTMRRTIQQTSSASDRNEDDGGGLEMTREILYMLSSNG